ncbi:rhomboid family intramembrane serine protease [Vulcanococcus sp.]|uniref:rhomboid family intramembrane serine protease n=1 Tax=Vulcanococcus sp. TaxID=2856995 RepID=UPI003C0C4473
MGLGKTLGVQLRQWLIQEPGALKNSRAIANRLIDALGADDGLKGPIRDLASQPLLLQVLHSQGAAQSAALTSLSALIRQTYAPAVQVELLELLEAATGEQEAGRSHTPAAPSRQEPKPEPKPKPEPTSTAKAAGGLAHLEPLAPGLALAASGALVLSWFGQELDRLIFEDWGWSGGVVLVLSLGLTQILSLGPARGLPRRWSLPSEQAGSPRDAWRWISAPWIHRNGLEASVNGVLLLIILGASPLQLGDVVLRYSLTALACLALSAACAQHWGIRRLWSGASGPVSALIALSAGSSLLHWKGHDFEAAGLSIPTWVLLLVYGALQLGWQLPRQDPDEQSRPLQRLLSSSCSWGFLLGLLWALISRLSALL